MQCDHICKECGKHETGSWFDSVSAKLKERRLCFSCDHWHDLIQAGEGTRKDECVRVNHVHYMVGRETSAPFHARGFGGERFRIRFNDGREVTTTNLWCQGRIPERFFDRLPDNAVMLPPENSAPRASR